MSNILSHQETCLHGSCVAFQLLRSIPGNTLRICCFAGWNQYVLKEFTPQHLVKNKTLQVQRNGETPAAVQDNFL